MSSITDTKTRSSVSTQYFGSDELQPINLDLPEVLFIASYPPRECGIATYTRDLIEAITEKFSASFSIKICALEGCTSYLYGQQVKYILPAFEYTAYEDLALNLNLNKNLCLVFVEHEFGLFGGDYGQHLLSLLCRLNKPVITTFHTILPDPDPERKKVVQGIADNSVSLVVMTLNAAKILEKEYAIAKEKITIIPHGTHLVSSFASREKKARNHLGNRLVLTTFGLLSPGKNIETALDAMPQIIREFPNVLYLIIGKTHPGVIQQEGERYRNYLEQKVQDLSLQGHVRFINRYMPLADLLTYLQRTDIYLFTSSDPFQAVSGTFAYAMSCGCPVISTPIPHAKELLAGAGLMVDFQRPDQLAELTIKLLSDTTLRHEMKLNALHKISPTAWPNAALAHVALLLRHTGKRIEQRYTLPPVSLSHMIRLTTDTGIIQFSKLASPDINSGYALDDNARALIAMCKYYEVTRDHSALVENYLGFIVSCQGKDGRFMNYVRADGTFDAKNQDENLEDANGRALWALSEFITREDLFDPALIAQAELSFLTAVYPLIKMRSPRAMSFVLKALCLYNVSKKSSILKEQIALLADDLIAKYRRVADSNWKWFESYLTYGNAVIPEAMLCAYLATGNPSYKIIAKLSFDFLLSIIFQNDEIKVVSNQGWLQKGQPAQRYGEQPIDIAYSILALDRFHEVFPGDGYQGKMQASFNWFLGKNHLNQIMYNPSTGGCYDGLEEHHINLNQGAESTVSYLLSRMVMEKNYNPVGLKKHKLLEEVY
jgi:glycosyltransferase involved in cell wall biosynthesis